MPTASGRGSAASCPRVRTARFFLRPAWSRTPTRPDSWCIPIPFGTSPSFSRPTTNWIRPGNICNSIGSASMACSRISATPLCVRAPCSGGERLLRWNQGRHGRAWPGHPRLGYSTKDVDARDKPAHDGVKRAELILDSDAMSFRRPHALLLAIGVAVLALASQKAGAETYPSRPVHLVVAFVPGGATDTLARQISND